MTDKVGVSAKELLDALSDDDRGYPMIGTPDSFRQRLPHWNDQESQRLMERSLHMEDDPIECPNCGSCNIAEILWSLPSFTDELQKEHAEGKVVLDGCCVSFDDSKYECNDCLRRFGKSMFTEGFVEIMEKRALKGIIYGAAAGDALGVFRQVR